MAFRKWPVTMNRGSRLIDMLQISAFGPSVRIRRFRSGLVLGLAATALMAAPLARAQFNVPATTQVHDITALRPPAGAKVAIVEFEDMECPDCANANPLLKEAAEKYKIPWVRHDFPLPMHNWSFQAAVNARWFDTKSKKMGDDYRDYVFANQRSIETPLQLSQFTSRFAEARQPHERRHRRISFRLPYATLF